MTDWRTRLAADLTAVIDCAGANTVTVTLTREQARALSKALDLAAAYSERSALPPATVRGAVE